MKKKILFVDDDPVFHYINATVIKTLMIDCEVQMAFNGKDALDIVSGDQNNRFVPDYIFVDTNLPVMDGFQFIQCFRALQIPGKENTTIIILTSSICSRDRSHAVALGIENYVVKPIKALELSRILQ
ncbi:MAG: response regulator [Chryseolinea sp.]